MKIDIIVPYGEIYVSSSSIHHTVYSQKVFFTGTAHSDVNHGIPTHTIICSLYDILNQVHLRQDSD